MVGIYGGGSYDRARENELDAYLDWLADEEDDEYDPEDFWDDDTY